METLQNILQAEIIRRLGWTLIHFIWQAAAVAIILAILLKLLRNASANLRYVICCLTLALIVVMPVVTLRLVDVSVPAPVKLTAEKLPSDSTGAQVIVEMPQIESPPVQVAATLGIPLKDRFIKTIEPALPYIVLGWLVGVFGLSIWHLGGWAQLQRLRRTMVKQVSERVRLRLRHLAMQMGVKHAIAIMESALVQVPTVVGWLKPVILLPATALTGLTAEQIEAILAHELAHIKRCDYLANILQTVVEILGFYHPAVWWVSRRIRFERENCCDDLAVSISGDRVCYARALTTMEEIRAGQPRLAVAASGGSLFDRIRRLLGKDSANEAKLSWLPSVIAIILVLAIVIPTALALSSGKNEQVDVKKDKIHVYQVNRNVSDFPGEDLSTPEAAYATCRKISASGKKYRWADISIKPLAERFKDMDEKDNIDIPAVMVELFLGTKIIEVRKTANLAGVIAEFPLRSDGTKVPQPIDCREFLFEEGKWLYLGRGGRFETMDEARNDFGLMCELYDRKDNPLEYSDEIKQAAKQLFDSIKDADYESFLNSKKKTWWNDFPTWNTYMSVKWHDELVKWICNTFKGNPIVKVELGEVFISDVKEADLKNLPAVPYKLTLKDGRIIEGNLPFRYLPKRKGSEVKAYWQGLHGIDWHLQDEPIKKNNLEAPSKRSEELQKRVESTKKMDELGKAFLMYVNDHAKKYPDALADIKSYLQDEQDLTWFLNNIEYLGKGKNITISPQAVIAYDKTMLHAENIEGTNVLYNDCHVAFERSEQLDKLVISAQQKLAPQILTTGYILKVPSDLPQLKEIISDDKSKTRMITPEKLEEFLNVVRNTPQSRMISLPKILTNDGETGEIRTENAEGFKSIKLNIKNTIQPDRKTVRLELDFEYSVSGGQDVSSTSVSTKAAILSKHAIAVAGSFSKNQAILLLVKPEILESQFSETGIVQVEEQLNRDPTTTELEKKIAEQNILLVRERSKTEKNEDNIRTIEELINVLEKRVEDQKSVDSFIQPFNNYIKEQFLSDRINFQQAITAKDDPANKVVYEQLDQIVYISGLGPQMPFAESLKKFTNSVEPPLKIVVLWQDLLENANIHPTMPIGTVESSPLRLGESLKRLLKSVSERATELDYIVNNGAVVIATKQALTPPMVVMVYDVSDLIKSGIDVNDIRMQILNTVFPDSWTQKGGEGTIKIHRDNEMVIRQTLEVHEKIHALLANMQGLSSAGFLLLHSDAQFEEEKAGKKAFGRVQGQLFIGNKPSAGEDIRLYLLEIKTNDVSPKRDGELKAITDSQGRFVFDRVPVGWASIGRLIVTSTPPLSGSYSTAYSLTNRTQIEVKENQTVDLTLGRTGRPVIGRVVMPADYQKDLTFGYGVRALTTLWDKTDPDRCLNPKYLQFTFKINRDGTFRIEDVPAGKYEIYVSIEGPPWESIQPKDYAGLHEVVEIPGIVGDHSDEPFDLGTLQLKAADTDPNQNTTEQVQGEGTADKAQIQIEARFLSIPADANEITSFLEAESSKCPPVIINGDPNLKSYFLNDKQQVEQFLMLLNANPDSKWLASPKVIVNNGKDATITINTPIRYTVNNEPEIKELHVGTIFQVKPTLQEGGRGILLEFEFEHTNLIGFFNGLPLTEMAQSKARISVPDGGTFLVGGQKITDFQDGQKVQKVLLCLIKVIKLGSSKLPLDD